MQDLNTLFQNGLKLHKQGDITNAKKIFEYIHNLYPNNFNLLFFLATSEAQSKNINRAISLFNKALEVNPNSPDCHFNLGNVLKEQGQLDLALDAYSNAINLKYDFCDAYYNRGLILINLDLLDEAEKSMEMAIITSTKADIKFAAQTYLAVINYLNSDFYKSRELTKLNKKYLNISDHFRIEKTYCEFIFILLDWRDKNPIRSDLKKIIYVLGESHSLSYHDTPVQFKQEDFICKSMWIPGCKQWHLGSSDNNLYKKNFMLVSSKIPEKSIVLFSIGEIDCRINEGILYYCSKHTQLNPKDVAKDTISNYLKFLKPVIDNHSWVPIISGIPRPNTAHLNLSEYDDNNFKEFISFFNSYLKLESLKLGFHFLDVHLLTSQKSVNMDVNWHIDSHHLFPSAISEAFVNYLV